MSKATRAPDVVEVRCRQCGQHFKAADTFVRLPTGAISAALGKVLCAGCKRSNGTLGHYAEPIVGDRPDWSELDYLREDALVKVIHGGD